MINPKSKTLARYFVLTSFFLGLGSTTIASHPYHVSSAEVGWNQTTGNFEVALCVWPADLELAISREKKTPIDLDQADDLDASLKKYISERFSIRRLETTERDADSVSTARIKTELIDENKMPIEKSFRWVGHEMDLKQAWLYFEIPGDLNAGTWQIENRVFYELNEDQINQIQLTAGSEVVSVGLNQDNPALEFSTTKNRRKAITRR